MTDHTTPEQLADWLEANSSGLYRPCNDAAAMLRTLSAELAQARAELEGLKAQGQHTKPRDPFAAAAAMETQPCSQCSGTMRGSTNGYAVFLRCDQCSAVPMPSLFPSPPTGDESAAIDSARAGRAG